MEASAAGGGGGGTRKGAPTVRAQGDTVPPPSPPPRPRGPRRWRCVGRDGGPETRRGRNAGDGNASVHMGSPRATTPLLPALLSPTPGPADCGGAVSQAQAVSVSVSEAHRPRRPAGGGACGAEPAGAGPAGRCAPPSCASAAGLWLGTSRAGEDASLQTQRRQAETHSTGRLHAELRTPKPTVGGPRGLSAVAPRGRVDTAANSELSAESRHGQARPELHAGNERLPAGTGHPPPGRRRAGSRGRTDRARTACAGRGGGREPDFRGSRRKHRERPEFKCPRTPAGCGRGAGSRGAGPSGPVSRLHRNTSRWTLHSSVGWGRVKQKGLGEETPC